MYDYDYDNFHFYYIMWWGREGKGGGGIEEKGMREDKGKNYIKTDIFLQISNFISHSNYTYNSCYLCRVFFEGARGQHKWENHRKCSRGFL